MKQQNVVAAVRVRPLVAREKLDQCGTCVRVLGPRQLLLGTDRAFEFDHVLGPQDSQERVFERCVRPLLKGIFDGYNATIFAYGQTSGGKTYTMGSGDSGTLLPDELGIIPRAIESLFDCASARVEAGAVSSASFFVTMIEIYNEQVRDLLHPKQELRVGGAQPHAAMASPPGGAATTPAIALRDDAVRGTQLTGVQDEAVESLDDVLRLLAVGAGNRTTGSTLMNSHSSRSHAMLTVLLEQVGSATVGAGIVSESAPVIEGAEIEPLSILQARIHFVDLAGSERAKKTGAEGARFRESVRINQGLLALGNVISALADRGAGRRRAHIPYRDSKLTRLLQSSLGGNSRTLMLACVSPADSSLEETLSSLKYASRARAIRNKPVINRARFEDSRAAERAAAAAVALMGVNASDAIGVDGVAEELSRARSEVESLRAQLERLTGTGPRRDAPRPPHALGNGSAGNRPVEYRDALRESQENARKLALRCAQHERVLQQQARQLSDAYQVAMRIGSDLAAAHVEAGAEAEAGPDSDSQTPLSPLAVECVAAAVQGARQSVRELLVLLSIPHEDRLGAAAADGGEAGNQATASGVGTTHANAISVRSLREALAARDAQLRHAKAALSEAREDLERDEEIFAGKLADIEKYQGMIKALHRENRALKKARGATESSSVEALGDGREEQGVIRAGEDEARSLGRTTNPETVTDDDVGDQWSVRGGDGADSDEDRVVMGVEAELDTAMDAMVNAKVPEDSEIAKAAQRQQQQQIATLRALEAAIAEKEALAHAVAQSEHESAHARQQYERRVQELERAVEKARAEASEAQAARESEAATTAQQARELELERDRTARKAEEQELQLSELRAQAVVYEQMAARVAAAEAEAKAAPSAAQLEAELKSMCAERAALQRELDGAKREERTRARALAAELEAFKRESRGRERRLQELEHTNKQQKQLLKRRTAEAISAQRKLRAEINGRFSAPSSPARSQGSPIASPSTSPATSPSTTPSRSRRSPSRDTVRASGCRTPSATMSQRRPSAPSPADVRRELKWFAHAVTSCVAAEQKEEQLQRTITGRAEALAKRDEATRGMHKLELRRQREEEAVRARLATIARIIDNVDAQLVDAEAGESKTAWVSDDKGKCEAGHEVLRQQRDALQTERAELERRLAEGDLLAQDDAHAHRELSEEVDALTAAIEYRDSSLSAAHGKGGAKHGMQGLLNRLAQVSEADPALSAALLQESTAKLIEAKQRDVDAVKAMAQMELQLVECRSTIEQLRGGIQRKDFEFNRQRDALVRQYEEHSRKLLAQLAQAQEQARETAKGSSSAQTGTSDTGQIQQLLQELQVLKEQYALLKRDHSGLQNYNGELLTRVNTLQKANAEDAVQADVARQRQQELHSVNRSLVTEVRNLKRFLKEHHAAQPVRISRKDLREVLVYSNSNSNSNRTHK